MSKTGEMFKRSFLFCVWDFSSQSKIQAHCKKNLFSHSPLQKGASHTYHPFQIERRTSSYGPAVLRAHIAKSNILLPAGNYRRHDPNNSQRKQ
eukprot:150918-Amphidinium_carterae.1